MLYQRTTLHKVRVASYAASVLDFAYGSRRMLPAIGALESLGRPYDASLLHLAVPCAATGHCKAASRPHTEPRAVTVPDTAQRLRRQTGICCIGRSASLLCKGGPEISGARKRTKEAMHRASTGHCIAIA
eukprot:3101112-Rhodomonas_salina.1